jgi:hypothetical protein
MVRLKQFAICFFVVVCISLLPALGHSAELAFYFPMEEINDGATPDVAGGLEGFLENNPQLVPGVRGNALQLNRAEHQFLQIFPDPAHNFGSDDVSLEAWVKTNPDSPDEQAALFTSWGAWVGEGTPCCRGYRLTSEPGGILTVIFNDGVPDEERLANEGFVTGGDTSVADSEWHHVVVSRVNTSTIQFWVDGQLDREIGEAAAAGSIDNTVTLHIGRTHREGDRGNHWDGLLDEVRGWRGALTADEIGRAMDGTAVEPAGKLPLVWGQIKANY